MSRLHLNIGSNQGDRRAIIGRAVALIARAFAPAHLQLSDYIETAPWGYSSPNTFLNRGVLVITDRTLDPFDTLRLTREIECVLAPGCPHRNPDGTYRDRPIDIDIIDLDRRTIDTPLLTLPHPRAAVRPFVTIPISQLDPALLQSL